VGTALAGRRSDGQNNKIKGRRLPAPVSWRTPPIVVTRRNFRRPRLTRTTASSNQGWQQDHPGRPDQNHQGDWCHCSSLTPSTVACDSRPCRYPKQKRGATPRRLLGGFPTCIGQRQSCPAKNPSLAPRARPRSSISLGHRCSRLNDAFSRPSLGLECDKRKTRALEHRLPTRRAERDSIRYTLGCTRQEGGMLLRRLRQKPIS
jgi:hypothetical protein